MATVYLARDAKLNRCAAIKVLRPELADLLGRERFLREIEIAAGLQHANILSLHDSGSDGGFLYYVMPYVEGESLRDHLDREKQLPVEEALRITRDVAAALAHAHSLGIVHRDIKPGNILLSGGRALVADFGIARAITVAGGTQLTERGIAVGTPAYMSPEQGSGQDSVDGRSDLYSLGCVLYEMLAGEPPFTGRTAQAIIARHLQERPPSLRVVRPLVSLGVQRVIETALAKVPADRYATAMQLVAALDSALKGRHERARRLLLMGGVALGLVGVGALWRFVLAPVRPLDSNRVVVFPLGETPAQATQEGSGVAVSLMIGSALEYTEPLRWIDGLPLLDAQLRSDISRLTAAEARAIARRRGARWYLDGTVVRLGDSATVVLRLNDAKGDSVMGRASATRVAPQAPQAGLEAVNQLLPRLLAPGRQIDLTALTERRPAAVASWLQGEGEYRRGNFDTALVYLRRAVDEDSALAVAALRGAQAAGWKSLLPEATRFAALALVHVKLLPVRQADLARGLAAYFDGQADTAVRWLSRALSATPDWTEAHMALGEVYHHLLPRVDGSLDSLAESEFSAAAVDTGFAPALFHLAEIAIRRRNLNRATQAVRQFERLGGGTEETSELTLMLGCAQRGSTGVNWRTAARESPFVVFSAAKMLSIAGAFPGCAEEAARVLLGTPAAGALHWGAFQLLHGLLAAQGHGTAIISLVDSLQRAGFWWATTAYVIDALAGTPQLESRVEEAVGSLRTVYGRMYEDSLDSSRLLLLGTWYARSRRSLDAARLHRRLRERAGRTHAPDAGLYADVLATHLVLARGDASTALSRFQRLVPVAPRDDLTWDYAASLPVERLTEAELLFARGRYQEALAVASTFDHPTPVVYLAFLPASLALRYRAAEALSRADEAARYRDRLAALGRTDLLGVQNRPFPKTGGVP